MEGRWIAVTVAMALGLVAALTAHFVPWGGVSEGGASVTAHAWDLRATFGPASDRSGWYSDDADDEDGVGLIRWGLPMLAIAGVLAALATGLTLWHSGELPWFGSMASLVAGAVLLLGTILMNAGIHEFFDGARGFEWGPGLFLSYAAAVILAAAGGIGLLFFDRVDSVEEIAERIAKKMA